MLTARDRLARLSAPRPAAQKKTNPSRPSASNFLHTYRATLPHHATHGQLPLRDVLTLVPDALGLLGRDERLSQVLPDELLFIDTETTGLWGGVGTVPFLVGLGFVKDGRLCTEQLLLGQLGHEGALLDQLALRLRRAKALVSYNGKCFDWPLIKARFLLNRRRLPQQMEDMPHLDLLFPSRRLIVGVEDHRLVSLEKSVCHFERVDDIPGAAIPDAYFAFLRHKDVEQLKSVIEHNRLDVVAMMALIGELAQRVTRGRQTGLAAAELLAVARVKYFANRHEEALEHAYQALSQGHGEAALAAALWAARLHGRKGAWHRAALWIERALLSSSGASSALAHLALAKIFEHRLRDLPRALRHGQRALGAETPEQHQKRLNRLQRRIARQGMA